MLSKKATAADVYWGESKKATYLNSHFEEDTRLAQGKVTWRTIGVLVLQAPILLRMNHITWISNRWNPALKCKKTSRVTHYALLLRGLLRLSQESKELGKISYYWELRGTSPSTGPTLASSSIRHKNIKIILIRKLSTREVSTIRFTCSLIEYCAENKNKMNRSPKLIFHSVVQVTRFEENYKESNGDYGKQGGCSTGEGKNFTECIRYHRSPH